MFILGCLFVASHFVQFIYSFTLLNLFIVEIIIYYYSRFIIIYEFIIIIYLFIHSFAVNDFEPRCETFTDLPKLNRENSFFGVPKNQSFDLLTFRHFFEIKTNYI